jgi:hypothetical protein
VQQSTKVEVVPNTTNAINMFLSHVVLRDGLPFDVWVPNSAIGQCAVRAHAERRTTLGLGGRNQRPARWPLRHGDPAPRRLLADMNVGWRHGRVQLAVCQRTCGFPAYGSPSGFIDRAQTACIGRRATRVLAGRRLRCRGTGPTRSYGFAPRYAICAVTRATHRRSFPDRQFMRGLHIMRSWAGRRGCRRRGAPRCSAPLSTIRAHSISSTSSATKPNCVWDWTFELNSGVWARSRVPPPPSTRRLVNPFSGMRRDDGYSRDIWLRNEGNISHAQRCG